MNIAYNSKTKAAAMAQLKADEKQVAAKIDRLVATGGLQEDDLEQQRGCFARGCFPFLRRGRRRLAQDTGLETAVFGQNAAKGTNAAAARLEQAASQVSSHAEGLASRAAEARKKAQLLAGMGKKQEAMMALKRCKTLEKQAETALATHAAIEQQQDMLQSSALQRDVASALSSAVKSTKVKTKGLLEKTEDAVDTSAELKDAFEDITEVLGGLNRNEFDDDELMAEIEAMSQSETATAQTEAPVEAPAKAQVEPQAIVVGIDPELFPKAPGRQRREQKQKLLDHDAAAEQAMQAAA